MAKLDTNSKLLIVVALLGGLASIKLIGGSSRYDDHETAQASETLFANFKKDVATTLLVEGPDGKKCELSKDGDHWKVVSEGDGRADKALVDKVLGAIEKLKKGRVMSSKGDNLARYGLDDVKAVKVTAFGASGTSGAPVAAFALGKIEGDWRNSFLKLPAESVVRKVEAAASDFAPSSGDSWRDKTMFDHGAADQVAQVEITGPSGAVVIAREKIMGEKAKSEGIPSPDGTPPPPATPPETPPSTPPEMEVKETVWNLVAPKTGRAKKWLCDSIAGYVAKLECENFHAAKETAAELGLDPPQYVLSVKREGETESKPVLFLGNKASDGKYAAKLPDPANPQIFWIAGWKGDYLIKTADDLLETPPAPPPSAPPADGAAGDGAMKDGAGTPPAPADGEKPEPAKPDDGAAQPPAGGGG